MDHKQWRESEEIHGKYLEGPSFASNLVKGSIEREFSVITSLYFTNIVLYSIEKMLFTIPQGHCLQILTPMYGVPLISHFTSMSVVAHGCSYMLAGQLGLGEGRAFNSLAECV